MNQQVFEVKSPRSGFQKIKGLLLGVESSKNNKSRMPVLQDIQVCAEEKEVKNDAGS